MKEFKKILAMVLSLSIMLNSAPISVFAEDAVTEEPVVEETQGEEQVIEEDEASSETDFIIEEESVDDAIVEDTIVEDEGESEEVVESEETPVEEQEFSDVQEEETDPVVEDTAEIVDTEVISDTPVDTTTESNDVDTPQSDPVAADVQTSYATSLVNDEIESYSLTYADEYRILHLDCGRKFFTKDWIIALINEMSAAGFTHLELAFGNDGLRFLLDDMSVTANSTTYSDDQVTAAIQAGNKAYYDAGSQNELTQTEMDAIIAHANSVGIEVIPLLNTPGHMDAIITAMQNLGFDSPQYKTSVGTVDVTDSAAVAFTQALVYKYMDYFAGKGCNEFNIGADEYANDIGNPQFSALISNGYYDEFITYINTLAEYAVSKNMIPMAFNDGIYYNQNTSNGTINENIMICYWSSGWSGYDVASASYLANKGFKMINTHGDYYFVLTSSGITNPSDSALNFDENTFMGSNVSDPAGSMFCIWCDAPGSATEQEVAVAARITLRKIAAAMQGTSSYSEDVVSGGFNADGTIAVTCNNETLTSEGVYVTACDLTNLVVAPVTENVPAVEGATNVVAWDMTPATEEGNYTGSATVKVPVPSYFNTLNMGAFVVNEDDSITKISGEYENGYYTFKMPHFSVGGIYDVVISSESTTTQEITLKVGDNVTVLDETGAHASDETNISPNVSIAVMDVKDIAGSTDVTVSSEKTTVLEDGSKYIIRVYDTDYALTSNSGSNAWGTQTLAFQDDNTAESDNIWTLEVSGDGYKLKCDAGYLNLGTKNNTAYLNETGEVFTITATTSGWTICNPYDKYINALGGLDSYHSAGGWTGDGTRFDLYKVEEPASDSTEITFTGVNVGSTTATVGNVTYNITVDYREETINLVKNGTVEKTQTIEITGDPIYSVDGIVTATVNESTVTFTAGETIGTTVVTVGTTIYTINVIDEDLTNVEPLTIEYWITNARVTTEQNGDVDSKVILATDSGIYSESGVSINELVIQFGYRNSDEMEYWRSRVLEKSTNEQTDAEGDDETLNGEGFTKVRYWNGEWQVYTDEWIVIDLDQHQLVAYYMQVTEITTEVTTKVVDWGPQYEEWVNLNGAEDWFWNSRYEKYVKGGQYVFMDYAVVYEDGTQNPSLFPNNGTVFFACDGDYRSVNGLLFVEDHEYEIWKVTLTDGTSTGYTSVDDFTITYDNSTETTIWELDVDGGVPYISSISNIPATEGKLVKIYIRTKVTVAEDALTVHYIDDIFNSEFYSYSIAVKEGTTFNQNFAMAENGHNELENNIVKNYYNIEQTVSADLQQMTEIGAQYRFSNFELVSVNFGEADDGSVNYKEVYLHYTFSPVRYFVADFGLPLVIKASDLDAQLTSSIVDSVEISSSKTQYGQIKVNSDNESITYTPTSVLDSVDGFTVVVNTNSAVTGILDSSATQVAFRVYVVPATNVYYEEAFIDNWSGNWSGTENGYTDYIQDTEVAATSTDVTTKVNSYGYDGVYAGDANGSHNSYATSNAMNDSASFEFTGTGFELYVNATTGTGSIVVTVQNSNGGAMKMYMVDTKIKDGDYISYGNDTYYSMPIVSVHDLEHGSYTVTLRHVMNDGKPLYIDGFRVFGTLESQQHFMYDGESNARYAEVRDLTLTNFNVVDNVSDDSKYQISNDVKTQVFENTGTYATAVILTNNPNRNYTDNDILVDLLDNGPKNELFLFAGESITFTLADGITSHIGMKSVNGAKLDYTYNINGESGNKELNSTVDMFYHEGAAGQITITNPEGSSGVLSITLLKLFDSGAADILDEVTEEQIGWALMSLRRTVVDEEVETPDVTEPEESTPDVENPDSEITTPESGSSNTGTTEEENNTSSEVTSPEAPEGGVANEGYPSSGSTETVEPDDSEVEEEVTPDKETAEDEETVTPEETEEDLPEVEVPNGFIGRILQAILSFLSSLANWFTGLF